MGKSFLYGAVLCLIASVSWGAMFPVAHHALQFIDPFYFTIFRYIPVAVILGLILWIKEGKRAFKTEGRGWIVWFFGTMAFTVYNLLIFWGQDAAGDSGVLLASVMESLMPMISILIVWLFLRRRPNVYSLGCVLIALIGVGLIITNGNPTGLFTQNTQLLAVTALFIAVVGWVVYTIGVGRFSDWSILRYSALSCIYGTATASVIVAATTYAGWVEAPTWGAIRSVQWDLVFMIVFPGLIALLGWNVGVRMIKPVNALLFINFVPITTVVITFIQGRALTMYEMIGVGLVLIALSLNYVFHRWRMDVRFNIKTRSRMQSV